MVWWNNSWLYKIPLVIDSSKIDAALTDFPVWVHLDAGSVDWTHINDDLSDIRFLDATETTVLDAELEDSVVNTTADIHVRVPAVADAPDTGIWMYFGNAAAASLWANETVWDSNFVMVQHMTDSPDTSHITDSTSNNNDGTKKAANEPILTASGKIDGAQSFDGTNDYMKANPNAGFQPTNTITVSSWINASNTANPHTVAQYGKWTGQSYGISINMFNDNPNKANFAFYNTDWRRVDDPDVFPLNVAVHLTGTYDYINLKLYVNGVLKNTVAYVGNFDYTTVNGFYFGAYYTSVGLANYFNGISDEVRVSNIARPSAWIKAEYWSGLGGLLAFGAETGQPVTVAEETVGRFRPRRDDEFARLAAQWLIARYNRRHGTWN